MPEGVEDGEYRGCGPVKFDTPFDMNIPRQE
jgi:hypothetical protein